MNDENPPVNPTDPDAPTLPIVEGDSVGDSIFDAAINIVKSALLTLWDMLKDLLIFIADTVMTVGMVILEGFATTLALVDLSKHITGFPPEVQYLFTMTGFGAAISIVMLAGTARLLMQLIPFVRLGS